MDSTSYCEETETTKKTSKYIVYCKVISAIEKNK